MYKMLLIGLALIVFSCNSPAPGPIAMTRPVENITATRDQQQRRKKSEDYCRAHALPVYNNPNSLFVDPEDSVTVRTKDEIVDRALALCYIGLKSAGLEQSKLDKMDKDYGIASRLTEEEKAYAFAAHPTSRQRTDADWRYEDLHVLLWALGFIDSLSYPDQMCEVAADVDIIHQLSEKQFRAKARLRSKQEILDQADLILRIDWACVNARIKNNPAPGGLNSEVVMERHHALNWLIDYMGQDWDNVSTDT